MFIIFSYLENYPQSYLADNHSKFCFFLINMCWSFLLPSNNFLLPLESKYFKTKIIQPRVLYISNNLLLMPIESTAGLVLCIIMLKVPDNNLWLLRSGNEQTEASNSHRHLCLNKNAQLKGILGYSKVIHPLKLTHSKFWLLKFWGSEQM